jgi:hypothetical protein
MVAVNVSLDNSSLPAAVIALQRASQVSPQAAPPIKTTATTLTPAELLGGLIVANPGAAVNYQLPLTVDLEAALLATTGALSIGDSFKFTVCNTATAANIVTLTTNTTWTLVGSMAVAGAVSGQFLVRRTAANAYTIYDAG